MVAELVNGVFVVKTDGYFNQEQGNRVFESCSKAIEEGHSTILIDMEASKMVNSIGVSMLIEVIEKLQEVDGTLSFCNLAPVVEKTFRIMGLVKYAKMFESREEAEKGLGG